MNKDYKFGFNYEEDLKTLYGKNYEEINDRREDLFFFLNSKCYDISLEIRNLKNIIQNPIPITNDEFKEWVLTKNKLITTIYIKPTIINILNDIENFVKKYHIKD